MTRLEELDLQEADWPLFTFSGTDDLRPTIHRLYKVVQKHQLQTFVRKLYHFRQHNMTDDISKWWDNEQILLIEKDTSLIQDQHTGFSISICLNYISMALNLSWEKFCLHYMYLGFDPLSKWWTTFHERLSILLFNNNNNDLIAPEHVGL